MSNSYVIPGVYIINKSSMIKLVTEDLPKFLASLADRDFEYEHGYWIYILGGGVLIYQTKPSDPFPLGTRHF